MNPTPLPPQSGPIYQVETFQDAHGRTVERHTLVHDDPGSTRPLGVARFLGKVAMAMQMGPHPSQVIQQLVMFDIPVIMLPDAFAQFDQLAQEAAHKREREIKQKLMGGSGLILPGG